MVLPHLQVLAPEVAPAQEIPRRVIPVQAILLQEIHQLVTLLQVILRKSPLMFVLRVTSVWTSKNVLTKEERIMVREISVVIVQRAVSSVGIALKENSNAHHSRKSSVVVMV